MFIKRPIMGLYIPSGALATIRPHRKTKGDVGQSVHSRERPPENIRCLRSLARTIFKNE
jgi:hypothetical protein